MEQRKPIKQLKDLTLLDRFLFAEAMEDSEFVENVLSIILGSEVLLKHLPQTEKEERRFLWSKQIRLDVWAMDQNDAIYETEAQKKNSGDIPRRVRLYHGLIDSKLLPPGSINYNRLNDVYIIMIMPFDLFGYNRYQYTFETTCQEIPELKLNDGAVSIFLNTRGTDRDNVSSELIELLNYFEHTTQETAEQAENDVIRRLHQKVEQIRSSEEMGVKYMQQWEEKLIERQEGYEEGRTEQQYLTARKLKEKGLSPEEITEVTGLSIEELADI